MQPSPIGILLGVLALLCAACGFDQISKPPPPDTSESQQVLDQPDGRFPDSADASDIFEQLAQVSQVYEAMCGYDPVLDPECLRDPDCRTCALLERLSAAIEAVVAAIGQAGDEPDGDPATEGGIPGVSGLLRSTTICDGWGDRPLADPAHGQFTATIGFTGRGVDPTIWGELSECKIIVRGQPVQLTGSYVLDFDAAALRASNYESVPVLLRFEGTVTPRGGDPLQAELLLRERIDRAGRLDIGLGTPTSGTFVMRVSDADAQLVSAGGVFVCSPEESACFLED